jgi:hypothetical protein
VAEPGDIRAQLPFLSPPKFAGGSTPLTCFRPGGANPRLALWEVCEVQTLGLSSSRAIKRRGSADSPGSSRCPSLALRIASTSPSLALGVLMASHWTARAAASASTVSDLPSRRRVCRLGRETLSHGREPAWVHGQPTARVSARFGVSRV